MHELHPKVFKQKILAALEHAADLIADDVARLENRTYRKISVRIFECAAQGMRVKLLNIGEGEL